VSFTDWLLFLHIASAFALVAALVTFWSVAIAARNVDRPVDSLRYFRISKPANILITLGTLGTLIFGIWLAIDFDAYKVWDGWILIALVLWFIAAGTGQRGGMTYQRAAQLAGRLDAENRGSEPSAELKALLQNRQAMWLTIISSVTVLLILIDMIYKPGA
jgi:uncharacterized membrane protein